MERQYVILVSEQGSPMGYLFERKKSGDPFYTTDVNKAQRFTEVNARKYSGLFNVHNVRRHRTAAVEKLQH